MTENKTIVDQIKFVFKFIFTLAITLPYEMIKSFFEEEKIRVRIYIAIFTVIYLAFEICGIVLLWKGITTVF